MTVLSGTYKFVFTLEKYLNQEKNEKLHIRKYRIMLLLVSIHQSNVLEVSYTSLAQTLVAQTPYMAQTRYHCIHLIQ